MDGYLLPSCQISRMDICFPCDRDHGWVPAPLMSEIMEGHHCFPYVSVHGRISASLISEIKNGYLLLLCQSHGWISASLLSEIMEGNLLPPYQISWTCFPRVRVSPAGSIEFNLHLLSLVDPTNTKVQDSSPYIRSMLNRLSFRKHNFYTFSSIKVNINLSLEQL